jgi:hypothetical protein
MKFLHLFIITSIVLAAAYGPLAASGSAHAFQAAAGGEKENASLRLGQWTV